MVRVFFCQKIETRIQANTISFFFQIRYRPEIPQVLSVSPTEKQLQTTDGHSNHQPCGGESSFLRPRSIVIIIIIICIIIIIFSIVIINMIYHLTLRVATSHNKDTVVYCGPGPSGVLQAVQCACAIHNIRRDVFT